MRSLSHPHVRTIMAVVDRAIASQLADVDDPDDSVVAAVLSMIITNGSCAEEFECFVRPRRERWTIESLRAVALAYALNAPAQDLAAYAASAREQHKWVEWWDAIGRFEACDEYPLPWHDEVRA